MTYNDLPMAKDAIQMGMIGEAHEYTCIRCGESREEHGCTTEEVVAFSDGELNTAFRLYCVDGHQPVPKEIVYNVGRVQITIIKRIFALEQGGA